MTAASDAELLRLYARQSSQEAFSILVGRHLGLVHAAALRQVRSADLARDVAQAVFIQLARDARKIRPDSVLAAWLHTAARRRALDLTRGEARRRRREEIACADALDPAGRPGPADSEILARLDEALLRLPASDRETLLLRFFSDKSLREVGQALGISDDTAQKRVERALDRLRSALRATGPGGALALGGWLSAHAAPLAPAGLAPAIASTALSHAAALASGAFASALVMTTAQKILFAACLALAAGAGFFQHHRAQTLQRELDELGRRQTEQARASSARIDALEAENRRLRDEARSSDTALRDIRHEAADPMIAEMTAWIERLQDLKEHLAAHPVFQSPALPRLTKHDWLDAAKDSLDTDRDYRRAAAQLRNQADTRFQHRAQAALRAFAKANGDAFPTDLAQLLPYFEKPIDPRMLDRWMILPQSDPRVSNIGVGKPDGQVITQRAAIDETYDQRLIFSNSGNGGNSFAGSKRQTTLLKLGAAYQAANPGREPKSPADLLPFATTPDERKVLEELSAH